MGQPIGYYANNSISPVIDLESFCGGCFDYLSESELIYVIKECANSIGDDDNVRPELKDLVQTLVNSSIPEVLIGVAMAGLDNLEIASEPAPIQSYFKTDDRLTDALIAYYGRHMEDASLQESAELLAIISCACGVDFSYVDEPASLELGESITHLDREELIKTVRGLVYMFYEQEPLTAFDDNNWVNRVCLTFGEKVDDCSLDDIAYWIHQGCGALTLSHIFSEEELSALAEIRLILGEDHEYDSYDCFNVCKGIANLMHHKYFTQSPQYA